MKSMSNTSYEEDDREFLSEFLDNLTEKYKTKIKEKNNTTDKESQRILDELEQIFMNNNINIAFNEFELNCLYYIGGYIIHSIKKQLTCDFCISKTGSLKDANSVYASLTRCKCFASDTLFFINQNTFQFFLSMEKIFRLFYEFCHELPIDLYQFFFLK